MVPDDHLLPTLEGPAAFLSTQWSVVLAAGRADSAEADAALDRLCRSYWYPLYAYVRRRGYSPEDAKDLTQGFFESLLQRNDLAGVGPEKGRFRTFLLASLGHYLANEWRRGQRQKRGGGRAAFSWDALSGEERFRLEPMATEAPERLYDRQWAWTVIEQVTARLAAEYARTGKLDLFETLRPLLTGDRPGVSRAEIATRFGITVGAVDVAWHRLRRRYGEILRDLIADTVSSPEDVNAEIRHLMAALGD